MFYIKNNDDNYNYGVLTCDSPIAWKVMDFPGKYWIGALNVRNNKTAMFATRTIAEKFLKNSNLNEDEYYIVELKEEVEGMKFYGIQFVTGWSDTELVSVIDMENPLHTESDVAVVSTKPEELVHLVNMLPEHSHGKIVEVFMTEDGKWEIGKDWYGEPVAQGYFYKLKGMSMPTYMKLADDGTVSLTTELSEATAMTNDVAMDLASKRGLKLTAFEKVNIDE